MPYLESLKVFVRIVELGSITAGGRDMRLTPAVASNRVKELENRLGVRLFNRTTRNLTPTEVGTMFYDHARKVVDTLEDAEAVVANFSHSPKGAIRVTAPLGLGQRIVAPLVPKFLDAYPEVNVRLRLSDRLVDILEDGLDVAFFLGEPKDSNLKMRKIMDTDRVLVAAPAYLARYGTPQSPQDLIDAPHNCLLLRFPRSPEYFWTLRGPDGPTKLEVSGSCDADCGDVLIQWALDGVGIANRARIEVQAHLDSGALIEVLPDTPPVGSVFGCLYPHRRLQDPKVRLFVDFAVREARAAMVASSADHKAI